MKKLMSVLFVMAILAVGFSSQSCVKGKKSCKQNHKRVQQMRKSGQIKM